MPTLQFSIDDRSNRLDTFRKWLLRGAVAAVFAFHGASKLAAIPSGFASQAATGVFVYDMTGRQYEKISDVPPGGGAAWLRDGRLLFAAANKLFLIDPSTRRTKELIAISLSDRILQPRLPADGRRLFFLKLSEESDIWMVQTGDRK